MLVWEIIGAIVLSGMLAGGVYILSIAAFLLYALARQLAHGAAKLLRLGKREKAHTEPKLDRPTHAPA
jgi:predicted tellurium resistance membrane protein TerC